MPFNPTKALEAWKKAKPLLLTDTGVSDVIRKLPANPTQAQLADYAKAVKSLETAMANSKVKAEKKALACITTIRDDIKGYLEEVKAERKAAMDAIKLVHGIAKQFHADVTAGPQTLVLVNSWTTRSAPGGQAWDNQVSAAAVPTDIRGKVTTGGFEQMIEAVRVMKQVMTDAESATPKFNTKKEMTEKLTSFKSGMDSLPTAYQKLASLSP